VIPTARRGSPASRRSRVAVALSYLTVRPVGNLLPAGPVGVHLVRAGMALVTTTGPTPSGVEVVPVEASFEGSRVSGEWVGHVPTIDEPILMYIHGSAFVGCSPRTHRGLVARLGLHCGRAAFSLRYRLAPQHRFPAAHDDVLAAYRWLVSLGYRNIVVAGDSAGGQLALSLGTQLQGINEPSPAALIGISPLIDLGVTEAFEGDPKDPFTSRRTAQRMIGMYTRGADPADPRLDLPTRLPYPPILIIVGEHELLRRGAQMFAAKTSTAGNDCTVQVWDGQMHVFPMMAFLPEASSALDEIARFINRIEQEA
jgi:epsilon-lactone hydrolase